MTTHPFIERLEHRNIQQKIFRPSTEISSERFDQLAALVHHVKVDHNPEHGYVDAQDPMDGLVDTVILEKYGVYLYAHYAALLRSEITFEKTKEYPYWKILTSHTVSQPQEMVK